MAQLALVTATQATEDELNANRSCSGTPGGGSVVLGLHRVDFASFNLIV